MPEYQLKLVTHFWLAQQKAASEADATGLGNAILDATMAAAASYATRLENLSGRTPGAGLDAGLVLALEGQEPDGTTCLDYHKKCSDWESQVSPAHPRNPCHFPQYCGCAEGLLKGRDHQLTCSFNGLMPLSPMYNGFAILLSIWYHCCHCWAPGCCPVFPG